MALIFFVMKVFKKGTMFWMSSPVKNRFSAILVTSCTRTWNFALHLLWCLTTESKNIVKLLAINKAIHTVWCEPCEDDYFPKGKFKLLKSFFNSVYPVFPKSLFSITDLFAVRYLWVVCTRWWKFAWHLLWCSTSQTLGNKPNHSHRVLWGRLFSKWKI